MQQVRVMLNGGSAEEADAVLEVLRQVGFDGPCTTDMHGQGEGIWMVLIEATPGLFLSGFVGAAGVDAWKRLKQFLDEIRVARSEDKGSHGQIYVRPEAVTSEEWEAGDRKGAVPGAPKPGTQEGLLIDNRMSDEELQALFADYPRPMRTFLERRDADHAAYLAAEVADGFSRAELLERMEGLLSLTKEAGYQWNNAYVALVYATIARSTRTFAGICLLLQAGLAVQAAMLSRSLFEDVLVAHWLILNSKDSEWLAERFLRHREAIALYQRTLEKETGMSMGGRPISVPADLESRAQALQEEFGKQATKNWWDPGKEGRGKGADVGIPEIVKRLEKAAADHVMFHPRFAGGDTAVLRKTDRVVNKWLSQCLHHTTIGLPFTPISMDDAEVPEDPMIVVSFRAAWLYSQQVYLLQEIERRDLRPIEAIWMYCLAGFVRVSDGANAEQAVEARWDDLWGKGESLRDAAENQYDRVKPRPWWQRLLRLIRK